MTDKTEKQYLVIFDRESQFAVCGTKEMAIEQVKECTQDYDIEDVQVFELGRKLNINISLD